MTSAAYLAAQTHALEVLDAAVEALSPLIGEKLLRPLADSLVGGGAAGVTLVPAGLLGLMSLHAIRWSDAAGNRPSLIDDFDVTFAPSARLHLACMQRASHRGGEPVRFVGIANPLPHPDPLAGAELELELVQGLMPTGESVVLKGEEATKERVSDVVSSATHALFACHGGGGLLDPLLSAARSLSGEEELSALEIAGLEMPARLVVVSACKTGVVQDYDAVDEALGLATAFVAAGAAGVVSTLWGGRPGNCPHRLQVLRRALPREQAAGYRAPRSSALDAGRRRGCDQCLHVESATAARTEPWRSVVECPQWIGTVRRTIVLGGLCLQWRLMPRPGCRF